MRLSVRLALIAAATAASAAPTATAHTVETFATLPANCEDISVGPDESVYLVSNPGGGACYKVTSAGVQSTIATGLQLPLGGVVDSAGNFYVSCWNGSHVHRIAPNGTKTVFHSATTPTGLVLSADEQTMYVCQYNPGSILRIDVPSGSATVVANGPTIVGPDGIALDESGNIYVANFVNPNITRIDALGNETLLTTLPGTQTGYIDYRDGYLYVSGLDTHRIYRVSVADGSFTTLAGSGLPGLIDGPADQARLQNPNGLALSKDGSIVWFQQQNRLRRVLLEGATAVVETVGEDDGGIAASIAIAPNPFDAGTRIRFTLPVATSIDLSVYDLGGRLVRRLDGRFRPAGAHEVDWDGADAEGRSVAAGIYHVRIATPLGTSSRKVLRVK